MVEGLYKATGDLAPLAEITKLKHKYKFRLVVDESLGFGTLGKRGRGACEHFGLQKQDVEIICASMGERHACSSPSQQEGGWGSAEPEFHCFCGLILKSRSTIGSPSFGHSSSDTSSTQAFPFGTLSADTRSIAKNTH